MVVSALTTFLLEKDGLGAEPVVLGVSGGGCEQHRQNAEDRLKQPHVGPRSSYMQYTVQNRDFGGATGSLGDVPQQNGIGISCFRLTMSERSPTTTRDRPRQLGTRDLRVPLTARDVSRKARVVA
jgi:hypothetical protein